MYFKSDNMCAVSSKIMDAICAVNHGVQNSYGSDKYSLQMQDKFSEIFETNVQVFLTSTGTAANSLALSALVKPHECIVCYQGSHINTDECGAPILFTGGSNLLLIAGPNGKLDINSLILQLDYALAVKARKQKLGCISVTQATEYGTIYSLDELSKITAIAMQYQLPIHMDGARFANSLVTLNCTPAEATWQRGIDVMSFGGTKNGCLNAEAIVFFNRKYAHYFEYLHKRAGQVMSKTRFFAAQFLAYLEDDLWLMNARLANNMANMLAEAFTQAGIKLAYPVEANEIFCYLEPDLVMHMINYGVEFYPWGLAQDKMYRFVTSCFTTTEEMQKLIQCLNQFNKVA